MSANKYLQNDATLQLLEDIGVEVTDELALAILEAAGASVDGRGHPRMPPMVMS